MLSEISKTMQFHRERSLSLLEPKILSRVTPSPHGTRRRQVVRDRRVDRRCRHVVEVRAPEGKHVFLETEAQLLLQNEGVRAPRLAEKAERPGAHVHLTREPF